jgi:hypothetical protein
MTGAILGHFFVCAPRNEALACLAEMVPTLLPEIVYNVNFIHKNLEGVCLDRSLYPPRDGPNLE